jgi:hypothetical protein
MVRLNIMEEAYGRRASSPHGRKEVERESDR